MLISVVTTMYRSAPYLEEFRRRALAAIAPTGHEVELVFVDDGSPDDSARVARRFLGGPVPTRVVELSRNYGHHRAIMVGLEHARGELVFLIDCDLEEPPELFARMLPELLAGRDTDDPVDVVYVVPVRRKGGVAERVSGAAFYWLFNRMTGLALPPNWMVARLMTRRYVRGLLAHRERELFLGGLFWITGFRQVGIEATKVHKGSTTWTLRRKLRAAAQAFTAFSDRPLWLLANFGGLVSLASALGIAFVLARWLLFDDAFQVGWPSLILSVSLFGGLTLLAVAIVGLYVARVFMEVKQRPCVVKDVLDNAADPAAARPAA